MERARGSGHLRDIAEDNGVAGGSLDLQHHLCGEEDMELLAIKITVRTLEIPLLGMPTVGFVFLQVYPGYIEVVDL
jgi:hypothetical protein